FPAAGQALPHQAEDELAGQRRLPLHRGKVPGFVLPRGAGAVLRLLAALGTLSFRTGAVLPRGSFHQVDLNTAGVQLPLLPVEPRPQHRRVVVVDLRRRRVHQLPEEEVHPFQDLPAAAEVGLQVDADAAAVPSASEGAVLLLEDPGIGQAEAVDALLDVAHQNAVALALLDRKSTRLNSSHVKNSYAVF